MYFYITLDHSHSFQHIFHIYYTLGYSLDIILTLYQLIIPLLLKSLPKLQLPSQKSVPTDKIACIIQDGKFGLKSFLENNE